MPNDECAVDVAHVLKGCFDMGNRAVITTAPYAETNVGIYLHWNGGRESVEAFLEAAKALGMRSPESDPSYSMARLVQIIGNYFGGSTSLGIGVCSELDTDNGDNGTYVIGGNWEIVGREFRTGFCDFNQAEKAAIFAEVMEKNAGPKSKADLLAASEAFLAELDSGNDFAAWEVAKGNLRAAVSTAKGQG